MYHVQFTQIRFILIRIPKKILLRLRFLIKKVAFKGFLMYYFDTDKTFNPNKFTTNIDGVDFKITVRSKEKRNTKVILTGLIFDKDNGSLVELEKGDRNKFIEITVTDKLGNDCLKKRLFLCEFYKEVFERITDILLRILQVKDDLFLKVKDYSVSKEEFEIRYNSELNLLETFPKPEVLKKLLQE